MAERDLAVRERLASDGSLLCGYPRGLTGSSADA
jgi:hypothetical protein